MTYGFRSTFFEPEGVSSPTSVANIEALKCPVVPTDAGTLVSDEYSFFHRLIRRTLKPQACALPGAYRSDLNGTAASTTHPPSNRPTLTFQIGFQSMLY